FRAPPLEKPRTGITSTVEQTARTWNHFRWWICGLLFVGTTINYIDRQVIALLKGTLTAEYHWTEQDFGDIVASFQFAYAFGYLFAGRMMDLVGIRRGYSLAVVGWSLAAIATAFATSKAGFMTARAALGLAEGGNFPVSVKTV